eukprot:6039049-Prymnesium_polylepis.1
MTEAIIAEVAASKAAAAETATRLKRKVSPNRCCRARKVEGRSLQAPFGTCALYALAASMANLSASKLTATSKILAESVDALYDMLPERISRRRLEGMDEAAVQVMLNHLGIGVAIFAAETQEWELWPPTEIVLHACKFALVLESRGKGVAHWDPVPIKGCFLLMRLTDVESFATEAGHSVCATAVAGDRRPASWIVAGEDEKGLQPAICVSNHETYTSIQRQ